MRPSIVFSCAAAVSVAAACGQQSDERRFTLQGEVIAIAAGRQEATIKHEDIKGLMPAMTMPYKVRETRLLDGIEPGDLIDAKLTIVSNDAYLTELRKVGQAPIEKPPAEAPAPTA